MAEYSSGRVRVRLPPPPAPTVSLWWIVASLFVSGALASFATAVLVSDFQSLARLQPEVSTPTRVAFYVVPVLAWVGVSAVVLPVMLREFTGARITAGDAVLATLAGGAIAALVRYPTQHRQVTPGAYVDVTSPLLLTWLATILGWSVSVWLIRRAVARRAAPTSTGQRVLPAEVSFLLPVALFVVAVVGIGALVQHRDAFRLGGREALRPDVTRYANELASAQAEVLEVVRDVATGPAGTASLRIRAHSFGLQADLVALRARSLLGDRGVGSGEAAAQFNSALEAFVRNLPRVAALRTTRAQLRALLSGPGLRDMYPALVRLQRELDDADVGVIVVDREHWSQVLRAMRAT